MRPPLRSDRGPARPWRVGWFNKLVKSGPTLLLHNGVGDPSEAAVIFETDGSIGVIETTEHS